MYAPQWGIHWKGKQNNEKVLSVFSHIVWTLLSLTRIIALHLSKIYDIKEIIKKWLLIELWFMCTAFFSQLSKYENQQRAITKKNTAGRVMVLAHCTPPQWDLSVYEVWSQYLKDFLSYAPDKNEV